MVVFEYRGLLFLSFSRPHYDDSVHDAITGAMSEWTLLIYLTGVEDGVEGNETTFIDVLGKQ